MISCLAYSHISPSVPSFHLSKICVFSIPKARMIPLKLSQFSAPSPSQGISSHSVKDKVTTMSYNTYKTWLPIIFWPVSHSSLYSSPASRTSLALPYKKCSICYSLLHYVHLPSLMKAEDFIGFVHNFISSVPRNVSGTSQAFNSYLLLDTNLTVSLCVMLC